jgi:hypothetical protein
MGLFRKTVAVSTLGMGARYRNKEERAEHNAKVMKKEAKKQTNLLEEIAKQQRGQG